VTKQAGGVERHYLYDDRRQRIADLDEWGRVTREYVWLADQLVAVIDPQAPRSTQAPAQDTAGQLAQAVAVVWQRFTGAGAHLAYVQVDHLGAPVAMTDENAQPIWAADYAPFGKRVEGGASGIVKTAAPDVHGIRLDLRLPGQWKDEESGLHYNDQRYYDPQAGRYLSPDPLGLGGGLNPYAYVNNNPLSFGDPLGLVLFAFDGTDNTNDVNWLSSHGSSLDNVWQFDQLYDSGNKRYITGVGTVYHDSVYGDIDPPALDDADNYTGVARIDRMIQYFDEEATLATDDNAAMDVDIIGFSRGAAEARDFANQIVSHTQNGLYTYTTTNSDGTQTTQCQKVNFRFMGLWDTVLSTNIGRSYNLAIPDQFTYVAQAVALNEYRGDSTHAHLSSFGAFPLESIMQQGTSSPSPVPGDTLIERGFIGAHADIGGGFGANENQLSQVALAWMVNQATAAGVTMGDSPALHTVVANPVLHDKSDSILTGAPAPGAEDRTVRYRNGTTTTQRQMTFSQGMSFADTQQYIDYLPVDDPRRRNFVTGTVDMAGYLQWLNDNGYGLNMTVQ
jgi:RHS repeat-associated protein